MLYKHAIRCHRTCMSNALYKILNSKEFVGIAKWKDKLWHRNNLCRIQGQCTHGKSLSPPKKTFSQYTWPIYYSPHIPTYNREHNAHKQAQAHLHAPDTINESLFLFNNSLCSNYISVAKKKQNTCNERYYKWQKLGGGLGMRLSTIQHNHPGLYRRDKLTWLTSQHRSLIVIHSCNSACSCTQPDYRSTLGIRTNDC